MSGFRFAVAVALGSLLAGCSTPGLQGHTSQDCRPHSDCDVVVDPQAGKWVPDEIVSKAGQKLQFKVRNNVARFADPGIRFKTAEGVAKFPCTRQNDHHVKCDNNGDLAIQYPYMVRILRSNGTVAEYDPFVWNR